MSKLSSTVKRTKTVKISQTNLNHHQSLLINKYISNYIINDVTDIDECELATTPCNIGVKAEKDKNESVDMLTLPA
jgi:hypothetical protein